MIPNPMVDTKQVQPVPEYELPAAPERPKLEPAEEQELLNAPPESAVP